MPRENEFRYVRRPAPTGVTSFAMPPPAAARSRVVVPRAHGDRCVPPARSRQRTRASANAESVAGERGAFSTDAIEWSDQQLDLPEIEKRYATPLIVRLCHEYQDNHGSSFHVDQIFQIHNFGRQARILATLENEQKVSIPVTQDCTVKVLSTKKAEKLNLTEVVKRRLLPVLVEFRKSGKSGDCELLRGQTVKLLESKQELVACANAITNGWIEQNHLVVIPTFCRLRMRVAVGLRGATDDEWRDYICMFSRSVRSLHLLTTSNQGIVPISKDPPPSVRRSRSFSHVFLSSNPTTQAQNDKRTPWSPETRHEVAVRPSPGNVNAQERRFQTYDHNLPEFQPKRDDLGRDEDRAQELEVTRLLEQVLQLAEYDQVPSVDKTYDRSHIEALHSRDGRRQPQTDNDKRAEKPRPAAGHGSKLSSDVGGDRAAGRISTNIRRQVEHYEKEKTAVVTPLRQKPRDQWTFPDKLSGIGVEEVCRCLQKLNMSEYCDNFRKQQIDGSLLSALELHDLQHEFRFNLFHAKKLIRFIAGWRPKS